MGYGLTFFLVLALVGSARGQPESERRRAEVAARTTGTNLAGTVLSLTVTGETSEFEVTSNSDGNVASVSGSAPTPVVEQGVAEGTDEQKAEPPAPVDQMVVEPETAEKVVQEEKSAPAPAPAPAPMAPVENPKPKRLPGRGKEKCLVNDISQAASLIEQGYTVTTVVKLSKSLVEITKAFKTRNSSSRVTIRATGIPEDVMKFCSVTLEDVGIKPKQIKNVAPAKANFTFTNKKEEQGDVEATRARLKKVCARLFGDSFEGVKEQCQKAVDSDYLDKKRAELEAGDGN